jgi:hypothetical protein
MSKPGYFVTHVDVLDKQRLLLTFEDGTIMWPNDADVAPELLYARAHEHAGQSRTSGSAWRASPYARVTRYCNLRNSTART